jgi:hypothetical protein
MENAQKVGRIQRGWLITKSSWQVLKLDKELATLPVIGFFATVAAIIPFVAVAALVANNTNSNGDDFPEGVGIALGVIAYFVLTIISNFFSGAVIYGAAQRFNGGNPSVGSCVNGTFARFRPLALFSLMMATVGLVLQAIEDRVPLAGQIAASLVGAAWNIANVFAIPVIVLGEKEVGPIGATKESVRIIKKVWGEGIAVSLGIGIIGLFTMFAYFIIWGGFAALASSAGGLNTAVTVVAIVAFALGLSVIILVLSVLGGIAKAALYQYATTGKAPDMFDQDLLASSARRVKSARV